MSELNWKEMHKHATTALEGEFPVVIVEANVTKTVDQSKDMIKCKVKIESGPFVDRPINVNFTISPESPVAMRIMFANWAVLGLNQRFFDANPNASLQQIADTLVGRRAIAVVGQREWNGRPFDDVKDWKPALSGIGAGSGAATIGGPLGGSPAAASGPLATPAATPVASSPVTSGPASPVSSPVAEQPSTPPPARPF